MSDTTKTITEEETLSLPSYIFQEILYITLVTYICHHILLPLITLLYVTQTICYFSAQLHVNMFPFKLLPLPYITVDHNLVNLCNHIFYLYCFTVGKFVMYDTP